MKSLLALLALAAPALAQLPVPGGSLTSSSPRPAPLLHVQADMAEGGSWSFVVPERPTPAHTRFEWTVSYTWLPLVGGQNRSGAPHPGFPMFSGSYINLWHHYVREDGTQALPGMGTSRAIHDEWGPTLPAGDLEHVPVDELHAHADDPTVYWGPPRFNPTEPLRFVTAHVLEPGWLCPEPGERVWLVPAGVWAVEGWDGSHEWPYRVDWNETVVAWGRWLPPS